MTATTSATTPGPLTPEQLAALTALQEAEAAGDPDEALRRCCRIPAMAGSLHRSRLALLAGLGERAPGWMWSRWMTAQAARSPSAHLRSAGDRQLGPLVEELLDVAHPHGIDPARLSGEFAGELSGEFADGADGGGAHGVPPELVLGALLQRDWVLRQLLVYEHGGLRDLVERRAGDLLLARADRIREWVDAPMGGYRLESDVDGCVQVTDLATRERLDLLDLGVAFEHWPGTHLLGRVVPTTTGPGRMFEWRPLEVDEVTARCVAQAGTWGSTSWVDVVRRRARSRDLPRMFSYQEDTSLVRDLPERCWVGVLDLAGFDLAEQEPGGEHGSASLEDLAFQALERLLRAAGRVGPQIAVARHPAFILVLDPDLGERARRDLVTPSYARGWRILGSVLAEPARARCREWAALSDTASERAS